MLINNVKGIPIDSPLREINVSQNFFLTRVLFGLIYSQIKKTISFFTPNFNVIIVI